MEIFFIVVGIIIFCCIVRSAYIENKRNNMSKEENTNENSFNQNNTHNFTSEFSTYNEFMKLHKMTFPVFLEKKYGFLAHQFLQIAYTTMEYYTYLDIKGASDDDKVRWYMSVSIYANLFLTKEMEELLHTSLTDSDIMQMIGDHCDKDRDKYIDLELIKRFEDNFFFNNI